MVGKSCFRWVSSFQVSRKRVLCALGAVLATAAVARAQAPAPAAPRAAGNHQGHQARSGEDLRPDRHQGLEHHASTAAGHG